MVDAIFSVFASSVKVIDIEGSKMWINLKEPNRSMRRTFQMYLLKSTHEKATTQFFRKIVKPSCIV